MSILRNKVNSIISALQSGDRSQERKLFNLTYNYLKIIALKYAFDKNDYEDILMEAYTKIFRYIDKADTNKDGYNWLCKIVQNVAYDFNKGVLPTVPLEVASFSSICGDMKDNLEQTDAVLREIFKLPEDKQRLIYLKFYEDLSYSEIAKEVGSKKSTVHKQVTDILKEIFNTLKD